MALGNPTMQLGAYNPVLLPLQRVKVIRAGWFGVDKLPVKVDQEFSMPRDEALGARALGRVKFV